MIIKNPDRLISILNIELPLEERKRVLELFKAENPDFSVLQDMTLSEEPFITHSPDFGSIAMEIFSGKPPKAGEIWNLENVKAFQILLTTQIQINDDTSIWRGLPVFSDSDMVSDSCFVGKGTEFFPEKTWIIDFRETIICENSKLKRLVDRTPATWSSVLFHAEWNHITWLSDSKFETGSGIEVLLPEGLLHGSEQADEDDADHREFMMNKYRHWWEVFLKYPAELLFTPVEEEQKPVILILSRPDFAYQHRLAASTSSAVPSFYDEGVSLLYTSDDLEIKLVFDSEFLYIGVFQLNDDKLPLKLYLELSGLSLLPFHADSDQNLNRAIFKIPADSNLEAILKSEFTLSIRDESDGYLFEQDFLIEFRPGSK
ncbi:MAG: hypothetical protein J0L62_11625 [Bacteroidetes bacterium]|nr:hypothetical protein [Bacteroidota bacterium]